MNRLDFLKSIYRYCEGKIEIRLLPSRTQIYCDSPAAASMSADVHKDQNIYFGVATRDGEGGGKDNVVEIPALWLDLDFKDIPRKDAVEKLAAFPFRPTFLIQSGGGFHAYWLLKEPGTRDDIPKIEEANRRIATALNGDLNACDAARILRVPDTLNIKYTPPRECNVVREFKDYEYEVTDFLEALDPLQEKTEPKPVSTNGSDWIYEAMSGTAQGNRNATGTKIAGYWINKVSPKETYLILQTWNKNNTPPLSDSELKIIARSVSRYEPEKENKPVERVTIDNVYTPKRMLESYRDYIATLKQNRFITGITELDKKIRGVAGGEVMTIIARSGAFKTTMLQNMLKNYVNNSAWGSIFFSIEMPVANLTERYLQQFDDATGREIEEHYSGGHDDFVKPIEAAFMHGLNKLFIVPTRVSLGDIKAYIRLVENHHKIKIGVVGVDYMGLIDQQGHNEYAVMSEIAKNTKVLAKELNIPIIMLCQTSRQGGTGTTEITMDMARGSGAIEEASDFLLGMWKELIPVEDAISRKIVDSRPNLICKILKNRKGSEGSKWRLDLDPACFRIGSGAERIVDEPTRKGGL